MFSKLFKNKSKYKFSDPENTACIVCRHVLENNMPILYATHDEDDNMWQFLCGADNHENQDAKIISLLEATEIDPSINDLYEMPVGVGATREKMNEQWNPLKL